MGEIDLIKRGVQKDFLKNFKGAGKKEKSPKKKTLQWRGWDVFGKIFQLDGGEKTLFVMRFYPKDVVTEKEIVEHILHIS